MTTAKKKRGRPRKPTPHLEDALFKAVAAGLPIRPACTEAGISYSAVSARAASDADFRDSLARAYLHGSVFSLDDAEHGLRTATPKNISVRREIAHHARWRASRLVPAYRDKVDVRADVNVAEEKEPMAVTDFVRRILFHAHREAMAAPLPDFIKSQRLALRMVADHVRIRGGGSTSDTRERHPNLFHEGRFGELAGAIDRMADILERTLTAPTPPVLPAPPEEPPAEREINPAPEPKPKEEEEPRGHLSGVRGSDQEQRRIIRDLPAVVSRQRKW